MTQTTTATEKQTVTIQFEAYGRRGTTVREKTFPSQAAFERWAEKTPDVTILRHER